MGRKIDPNSGRQARAAREKELAESKKSPRQRRVDLLTGRIAGELLSANPHLEDADEIQLVKAVVRFVVLRLVPPQPIADMIATKGEEDRQKMIARGDVPPSYNSVACSTDGYGLFLRLYDVLFNLEVCRKPRLEPPSPDLVAALCCPICKGALTHDAASDRLHCGACDHTYPLK